MLTGIATRTATGIATGIVKSVFPRPRRRVGLGSAWPLAAFAVAFTGLVLYLVLGRVVNFTYPPAFLVLAVSPWIWWMGVAGASGLTRARLGAAILVRLFVLGVFAMVLAGPRAVRTSDVLSLVYAIDLSDSMGEKAQDRALAFMVNTVSGKRESDEAGLVVFGREAAVELPPRQSFPFEAINCRVSRDATNIEKALSLAGAVLPEAHQGRIVLVTDGVSTEGTLARVLDELGSRGVSVDVLPVQYDIPHEVWLERLGLPRAVKIGETYEAAVILSSLQSGRATLRLTENGEEVYKGKVEYSAGKNRFSLPLRLRGAGYYEYVARVDPPAGRDGWQENNVAVNHLYLEGEGRILVVTDPEGDARDWRSLERVLQEAERMTRVKTTYDFPRDALSLMPFDCVVLANVPADALDLGQQEALRDAVYSQGIGLLMVGGKNSFGPGGYHRTPVEEALPVTMDVTHRKQLPKGALVIVLHTCEFPEGNTWGKRIAKEAIRVLSSEDEVGVLVYGYAGGVKWLFPLTPAREYERLATLVNRAQIGDMPDFGTTMQMGLAALTSPKCDAAAKHMIIISDGDPSPPPPGLLGRFANNRISVSTVAINPHGGQSVSVMRMIAGATGGRYYFAKTGAELPAIFIKEAKTLKRNMIQNKTFTPEVASFSPLLKGVGEMPELRGYVLTSPKPRSTVVLEGPEEEGERDPVLAIWNYGVGKAAAFTSDISPNWGAKWLEWAQCRALVKQLMTEISRADKETKIHVRAAASGNAGLVTVEDYHEKESFLEVSAVVVGPRRKAESIRLRQVGPRRYQGKFPLWGRGQYQVTVSARAGGGGPGEVGGDGNGDEDGGRHERAIGGFTVPYSPEYLRFRSDPQILKRIAERTGGRVLKPETTGEELFGAGRKPKRSSRAAVDLFLVMLACLIPLDVGIRRIQLDVYVIKSWLGLGAKHEPSGATLGALLARKKTVDTAFEEKRGAAPPAFAPRPAEERPKRASPPRPAKEAAPAAEEAPEDVSTTGRLLALKRKWKKGGKGGADGDGRK